VLSVTTETAIHSSQAYLRARAPSDENATPSTGFSALVDSNTDAATASRDNGTHQGDDQSASVTDDSVPNSAPARGKAPAARATAGDSDNANANNKTDATSADPTATQGNANGTDSTPATTTAVADVSTVLTTDAPEATDGKDKTAKTDDTADANADTTTPQVQVDPSVTIVAVVVDAAANPVTATAPKTDGTQAVGVATAPKAGTPGAIALAAASRVAADVAAGEPKTAPASDGAPATPPANAGDGAAAQVQVMTDTSGSGAAVADGQPTAAAATDATSIAQAEVAPQVAASLKLDVQAPPSGGKGEKSGPITIEPKASAASIIQGDGVDNPMDAAPPNGEAAALPNRNITRKSAAPEADARADTGASQSTDADAPVTLALHQHTSAADARATQPNTMNALDVASAAQASAVNATAPAPTPTVTLLNTANLTVVVAQTIPLNGLAVEISANAKAGNSRFEIRLDPPELGRIDVRLDVDRNGQVTSRLFVEKSEILDLLRRDAPQLQQALQDAGLKTSDSGLQFSLRDQNPQQNRNDGNGSGQDPQRLVIAEDDAATASAAGRSYGRSLATSGGVDIRV
jgi:flagellar hook-length control protein FliK